MHLKISNLAASVILKRSCDIDRNEMEELLFNYDSEQQQILNVPNREHRTW
jgi:hypothetical protein